MALMVLVISVCRAVLELTIPLMVALLNALITTTSRSPAAWARLKVSVSAWLFHPVQPESLVLNVPSLFAVRPK